MTENILNVDQDPTVVISANLDIYRKIDNIFVISHSLLSKQLPMWVGWNSQIYIDFSPRQKIYYLPQINMSPTSSAVVAETLKMAKKIASEINQEVITVTYDLAIAKIAFQIQSTEAPFYDNVFIQLGAFHIQMAYFKAVGKYIEESGCVSGSRTYCVWIC